MTTTASYEAWLQEVGQALASINMPMEEWETQWAFDFPREFRSGAVANDSAMKANRFWWHEQNKAVHQDCTLSGECWLPRGHQGRRQPVTQDASGAPTVKNSTIYDPRLIQAVNARAKVYRVLCYLMHFYGPCVATKIVANAVQSCHEEAIRLNTQA